MDFIMLTITENSFNSERIVFLVFFFSIASALHGMQCPSVVSVTNPQRTDKPSLCNFHLLSPFKHGLMNEIVVNVNRMDNPLLALALVSLIIFTKTIQPKEQTVPILNAFFLFSSSFSSSVVVFSLRALFKLHPSLSVTFSQFVT